MSQMFQKKNKMNFAHLSEIFVPLFRNMVTNMKRVLLLITLLVGICCGVSAQTQKKMVVLSDPHVMAPSLLESDGTAWTNYLNKERKMVDNSQLLYDEMMTRIMTASPDLVLITGDLTKDGEQVSHEYVISKLNELRASGIQVLVIPGNHDRGANRNAVYYNGVSTTAAAVADNDWFAEHYVNYGYGNSSEREETTLTYACEPIDGLVVIGIDSGRRGIVSSTTLNWVKEKAETAKANGKRVIAMMHHPLMPHFTGVNTFESSAVVQNYGTVRNTLADAGIRVVFTGHFHTSDIAKDWNDDMKREIYDVNTGSLIAYPCDYRVVTMSDDFSEMAITTNHCTAVNAATAKERLQAAVQAQIAAKVAIPDIAAAAAQAYVIHAEGNEQENPASASVLTAFSGAATDVGEEMAQQLIVMANSMLQDKSQYGTVRENVTNDRTLAVGRTDEATAITGIETISNDSDAKYNLAGRRITSLHHGVYIQGGRLVQQ